MKHRTLPVLLLALALAGCGSIQKIPLFNPEAPLKNKIASANESITELAGQVMEVRDRGWLTQEQINSGIGKSLEDAAKVVDEAERLYRLGNLPDSETNIDTAKGMLTVLRQTLESIRKEHR